MAQHTVEVILPLMGEGVNEATLVKWLKNVGQPVKKDEPLFEVSTDKVDTEIPSPATGVLAELIARDGQTVFVNAVLAKITAEGEAPVGLPERKGGTAQSKTPTATATAATHAGSGARPSVDVFRPAAHGGRVKASPLARKMARERNVDLSRVMGTGLNGKVTKRDFEAALAAGFPAAGNAPVAQPEPLLARVDTRTVDGIEQLEGVPVRREKMTKMRRLTAEHMVKSVRTSPHVTTVFEIDLKKVVDLREKEKANFQKQHGFNLTYTAFFLHAAVQAIKEHPIVNVSVDGDEILYKDQINIGCAVAIKSGLIVPVIKRAGDMSLVDIARKLNDLVTRARDSKLMPEDVVGGTFTVTNPGGWGSIISAPIINQPQVAILSIGAIVKKPVVIENDQIVVRPMCTFGLTFDHRVIDGEGGAKYLMTLQDKLQNPTL